jgi:hypothetical protein
VTEANLARLEARLTEMVNHIGGIWRRQELLAGSVHPEHGRSLVDDAVQRHSENLAPSHIASGKPQESMQVSDFPGSNVGPESVSPAHRINLNASHEQATRGLLNLILNLFKSRGR